MVGLGDWKEGNKVMTMRTKVCSTCGKHFSYKIGRGKDRKHCSKECRVKHQIKLREERFRTYSKCSTPGCNKTANRRKYNLCETCYFRMRRTGTTTKIERKPKYRYITGAGYIKLFIPGHPLADNQGTVFEHRKVLYDKLGDGIHQCQWCGAEISWDDIVVDHLNENKQDNSPDNLVASCNNCNRARGAMIPFIERMKTESFDLFIEVITKYKRHYDRKTATEDGGFGND